MTNLVPGYGPKNAKIAIVGDYPGKKEVTIGLPFVGNAGKELEEMLRVAGINIGACYKTNVFKTPPPHNDIANWCSKKSELDKTYYHPPIAQSKYLNPEHLHCIEDLREELREISPNIIIALGSTALWALTGDNKIAKSRGVIIDNPLGKILPTYHPSAIFRQFSFRPICIMDFFKVKHEAEFKEAPAKNLSELQPPCHNLLQAFQASEMSLLDDVAHHHP